MIIDVIETKILYELLKGLENLGVDDELARISHFCYQLKSNGWSSIPNQNEDAFVATQKLSVRRSTNDCAIAG